MHRLPPGAFSGPIVHHQSPRRHSRQPVLTGPDVIEYGHPFEQAQILKGARDAHADDAVSGETGDLPTSEPDTAGGRRDETREDIEQRCLAGSIGSYHPHDLTRRYGKV